MDGDSIGSGEKLGDGVHRRLVRCSVQSVRRHGTGSAAGARMQEEDPAEYGSGDGQCDAENDESAAARLIRDGGGVPAHAVLTGGGEREDARG